MCPWEERLDEQRVAPYGSWRSPITSDLIVSDAVRLSQVTPHGGDVYWIEGRPQERGRNVLVRRAPDGRTVDVTPPLFNVRTRVHEYGGASFVLSGRTVFFSNFQDQRIYRQDLDGQPEPITPETDLRYADAVIDRRRDRMVCVREDHTAEGREAVNTLVAIDLDRGGPGEVLVSGKDFYSSPRLSPNGSTLAWIEWRHPNMPWDTTELWAGELDAAGAVTRKQLVAGGDDESVLQPLWSPDGVLHFVSDRTGWWNLYRWRDGEAGPLCEMEAEFGGPQWVLGAPQYAFESARRIICAYTAQGGWRLAALDTVTGRIDPIDTPFSDMSRGGVRVHDGQAFLGAGSPTEFFSVLKVQLTTGRTEVLRRTNEVGVDEKYLSGPEAIEFPTEGGLTAHAFFYPPENSDYKAPPGEKPPLLVISHGGPTGAASTSLDLSVQYWTSRGVAVLDVNYGGSTGYGTAYRRRLNGNWGVVDVDDCVNGALFLVDQGRVDGDRLAIKGGSAGGYTTLSALTFRNVFKAGASYYGISDLEALARDTHKFESRYLDTMIGPYPERRDLYLQRSPIHHTDGLSCPIILFQGLEDKVVPPNQAEEMLEALRRKGLTVAYVPFEGEQHGFRRAESIKRSLDGELYFYSRVFGFELGDPVKPVPIENL
ncbi:MAG: S9 family peptidase [SAR202 cluster bacterium]|nr:S9 family peptidase [SAR202 cluster bacterium]